MSAEDTVDSADGAESDVEEDVEAADEQTEPLDLTVDERKLVTQPYDMGVKGIKDDIGRGRLQLNIQYQRKYVWDQAKASRLIESLLLNVPIPVCYFSEDEDGNYEVIDGLQRLTTIREFLDNHFALSGISVLKELEGYTYSDLAPRDQRRLENRTIRCIVITEESHPDIKFDVFERLNTGAASLTAQEIRNCIYRGELNDSLRRLARLPDFVALMGNYGNRRMEHEEIILRFFALVEGLATYKPPLRQFLNTYMRAKRNHSPNSELVALFEQSCEAIHGALGPGAFRATSRDGRVHRTVNKALFDSIMVPAAFCDRDALVASAERVQELRDNMLEDEEFLASIGRATADRARMTLRIQRFAEGLRELGIGVRLPLTEG